VRARVPERTRTDRPNEEEVERDPTWAWMALALALSLAFAARAMRPGLDPEVVIDDTREYLVFLHRFRDPDLYRGDLIADYFQSVTPVGFQAIYWILGRVVDPLHATKLLPPVLGLVTAAFSFLLARRLHPSLHAAFLASVLVSWYIWQGGDLVSATPRAFLPPVLSMLLWALAGGRLALAVGLVFLAALVYPVGGLLGVALLGVRLATFRGGRPGLTLDRAAWLAFSVAAVAVVGLLLLGRLPAAQFGPLVSGEQARAMPAFGPDGRHPYFVGEAHEFWLTGMHSGLPLRLIDPARPRIPVMLKLLALAALLPLLALLHRGLPDVRGPSARAAILAQLLVASLGMFVLAHVLFFHLFFPGRYVKFSLPLILALAAGLALGILLEALAARAAPSRRRVVAALLALGLGLLAFVYPSNRPEFLRDPHPAITAYLAAQPKDALVAGVPLQVDFIPALARRPILVGYEYTLPFHRGYHEEMERRIWDVVAAYYAHSPDELVGFADRHGVDYFLVSRAAFRAESFAESWTGDQDKRWEPFTPAVARKLSESGPFVLLEAADLCAVVDDGEAALVPTDCLRREARQQ
jgi:hypothetical protein